MSNYSECIRDLENVRDYMKSFYIYGLKTRNDFTQHSKRTYDNAKRRIKSWLDNVVKSTNTTKGKQVSISADCGQLYVNPLYKAYQSKSFTDRDIHLHFYILDILQTYGKLSLKEIDDMVYLDYNFAVGEQTIRAKLEEYVSEGILTKTAKEGSSTNLYALSEDPSFIHNEEFQWAVEYASMAFPFGVVGYYLLNQLHLSNDTFLTKHNYIVHTLEDAVLLPIVEAINSHQAVRVTKFAKDNSQNTMEGIPLRVNVSTQTGRRYLVVCTPNGMVFKSIRLDFIRSVETLGYVDNYQHYQLLLDDASTYCWGTSFGSLDRLSSIEYLTFTVRIELPKEDYILERLKRECRNGKVSQVASDEYSCTIETFDTNETIGWVRSFMGRIVSVTGSNQSVIDRLYGDVNTMYQKYLD